MRKLAGLVFDAHDDLDGRVLRTLLPDLAQVPPFIKQATHLQGDQIDKLGDDHFALVMLDNGRKLKKYATIDAGNVALSVMYLGHQAHLLPPEAVKTAATNLVGACYQYGMAPPMWLKLAAEVGISSVASRAQAAHAKQAQASQISPNESAENPRLGEVPTADKDLQERANMGGTAGTNFLEVPVFSQKEKQRNDTAVVEKRAANYDEVRQRQKSWRTSPYVDVSAWDPEAHQVTDHQAPQQTLIQGHYPIDGYDQVKTASSYFEEHWKEFHPRDRHEYCVKLAVRLAELGQPVPADVERYGSQTYAADVDSMLESRRALVNEDYHPALNTLIEKRAMVEPGTFAEAVSEFDHMTNLHFFWDSQVPDPWYSTFGPGVEKVAEAEWTWNQMGVFIDTNDLERLALNGKFLVAKQFGKEFMERFAKNPQKTFTGLPKATQLVLARMASDKHAGTATE